MAPRIGHVFKPLMQRLEEKYLPEPNSGCWLWIGADSGEGYGRLSAGNKGTMQAHRCSYELHVGPIPNDLHLDHTCRTPCCVNPDHLEPVTNAENTLRGKVSALRAPRIACKRGHALADHGYRDTQGAMQCRECLHIRQKAYYQRRLDRVV